MKRVSWWVVLVAAAVLSLAAAETVSANQSNAREELVNPERGFYRTAYLTLQPEGGGAAPLPWGPLVHLRMCLAPFSSAAGGTDAPLSEAALESLRATLRALRQSGQGVIIRSSYDDNTGKHPEPEPSPELMEQHLRQLGAVYGEFADVIVCLELGTLGHWGEMHGTPSCTQENINRMLDTLLAATPETLTVNVRTPQHVAGWLGLEPQSPLDGHSAAYLAAMKEKPHARRVGMFNDGYLGSDSDLGSFNRVPRAAAVSWLNDAGTRTFYGGEAVVDVSGQPLGAYNCLTHVCEEAPQTHTTYLNYEWNQRLHEAWRGETYNGPDRDYAGCDGYTYIRDHLGYRLDLRRAEYAHGRLHFAIGNTGFAPVIRPKRAELLLVHEESGETRVCPLPDFDVRRIAPGSCGNYTFMLRDLKPGTWTARLRLLCPGYEGCPQPPAIRLAAPPENWDPATRSNRLLQFRIR